MTDYKTLEELSPKVGDTVAYRGFEEYKVGPNQTLICPDGASLKYQGWDVHRCFTLKEKDVKIGSLKEIGAKVGDIVECVRWRGDYYTEGNFYPVIKGFGKREVSIGTEDSTGDWRIISRASDTPKLWRDMTPEEKGALLLAAHDGRDLEYWRRGSGGWASCSSAGIYDNEAYRVKPQPKIETVTIRANDLSFGFQTVAVQGHEITFNLIDGVPDCNSIKMEKLK